jgi:benzoate-CoA ligase family protein
LNARQSTKVNALEHYLERQVLAGRSSQVVFLTPDGALTYGELWEQVQRATGLLHEAGVGRGDRVMIVLPDSILAVVFLLGAIGIGAVPAPVPSYLREEEHEFICADCEPLAAVVQDDQAERMARIRAQVGWPQTIFVAATSVLQSDLVPVAAALAGADRHDPVLVSPEDAALLQYTSGSTGRPKGVVHLHRGLLRLPEGFGRHLALTEADLCYSAAKLSFGYGLGNSVLLPLDAGAAAFLRAPPSDPLGALDAIQLTRPTVFFAGPTLYGAIAAIPGVERAYDLSSIRLYVSAGDVLSASVFRRWQERFGQCVMDGLGSTECLHIFMAGRAGALRAGSLGEVIPPYEARLCNDDGSPTPLGETGHLEVRGPANSARYWNRPEDTERTMVGGWIRTRDLLARDGDGGFRYIGRADDVFKVRELKVSPIEIEELLNAHPAVRECAVVGRTDAHGLTVACAIVRVTEGYRPGNALARELRASLRGSLLPHKLPQLFEFVEALPRTSTGKLARYNLRRERPLAGQGR